ncbi:bypass of forespore C [Paenibacillus sp. 32O-W]|uniref:BofC C-terminal domain-containing protein n=1 Tax=Paenibacillus sp. 32O-W TaxID=1695218 RepID=UPI000721716A|nr:BofC C-terminal domain-containing protein [Paenibacillus sp. 32O-W]ALS27013.1 bypass of forespore C [Paenibacillus sp. 32O-W]
MQFSLWKQIKKRLRRAKRPILSLGCWAALAAAIWNVPAVADGAPQHPAGRDASGTAAVIESIADSNVPHEVYVRRIYICGEETERLGTMTSRKVIGLLRSHSEWSAEIDQDGAVRIVERIEDLADTCRGQVYIGLDKQGNVALFAGPPKREKVIRTFFQIDIQYMESSLPKDRVDRLIEGIRINDIDEYNSVLSTYSDYALEHSEKVMKPAD